MILGIDIDTYKLTLCWWEPDVGQAQWRTARLREWGSASALDAVRATPLGLANATMGMHAPREVYVERGWGQNRRGEFELGAIFGATIVAIPRVYPGAHVDWMPTHIWKKAVTAQVGLTTKAGEPGVGNAAKDVTTAAVLAILGSHDIERNVTVDECDAFGVAWAAAANWAIPSAAS